MHAPAPGFNLCARFKHYACAFYQMSSAPFRSKQRRSQRVVANVPIVVSAESPAGLLAEETTTVIVNAHGALILLEAEVALNQQLVIKHGTSFEQQNCRVIDIGASSVGAKPVAIEFLKPAPRFWHISFPPADWTSVDGTAD